MNPAIKTAINIVGSQKKLGAACEVSQQAVYRCSFCDCSYRICGSNLFSMAILRS